MVNPPEDKSTKKITNAYHYDAHLALAFQSDCESLLQVFKQGQNLTFKAFAQAWRKMCFLGIYEGQEHILALQTFIENCFFIVKKFLHYTDLHVQTGAIYFMYGLYYKQPIKNWVKIRLTAADYEKLCEIVEIHKANGHLDTSYIFSKMRLDQVFEYCALPQPLGLDQKFMRRIDISNEEVNVKLPKPDVQQKLRDLMENDPDMLEYKEIDTEYQKLAKKYMEKHGNLFVFPSKIEEELKKIYSETFETALDDQEEGEQESPSKRTRNKAMSSMNAKYRGERKVVTALDLEAPSTSKGLYN